MDYIVVILFYVTNATVNTQKNIYFSYLQIPVLYLKIEKKLSSRCISSGIGSYLLYTY